MKSTRFWDECYANGNTLWDRGAVHPALRCWLEHGHAVGESIIVPGCGRGHEVIELARRGFEVTAIDFASDPVNELNEQLAQTGQHARVLQQDIFQFKPDDLFDFVWEQTCLCAIDPQSRSDYERAVFTWLKPNGKLLVLFAQTGRPDKGPPFHCDFDEMRELFTESRWCWSDTLKEYAHPSGKLTEYATTLTRRS